MYIYIYICNMYVYTYIICMSNMCVCVFGYDPNPCTGNPDLNQPAINGMTVLRSLELQHRWSNRRRCWGMLWKLCRACSCTTWHPGESILLLLYISIPYVYTILYHYMYSLSIYIYIHIYIYIEGYPARSTGLTVEIAGNSSQALLSALDRWCRYWLNFKTRQITNGLVNV